MLLDSSAARKQWRFAIHAHGTARRDVSRCQDFDAPGVPGGGRRYRCTGWRHGYRDGVATEVCDRAPPSPRMESAAAAEAHPTSYFVSLPSLESPMDFVMASQNDVCNDSMDLN